MVVQVIVQLIILVIYSPFICSSEHFISVDAIDGHNNASCLQSNQQPCKTLEYVQGQLKAVTSHSVVIEICEPGINLTRSLNFTDLISFSIIGSKIICNTSDAGLSFINVNGLLLKNKQIGNCGTVHPMTCNSYHKTTQQSTLLKISAVYILHCSNVTISDLVVYRSNGTGITMSETYGQVLLERTNVLESSLGVSSFKMAYYAGSGLSIEFNLCKNYSDSNIGSARYQINDCEFLSNVASVSVKLNMPDFLYIYGGGGGASINFGPNASNISITINRSVFKDNYSASSSGGLIVSDFHHTRENLVIIMCTHFINNCVPHPNTGGGLQVFWGFSYDALNTKMIHLSSCEFINNSAHRGRGIDIFVNEGNSHTNIEFINCSWNGNSALYGAAVHMMPRMWVAESHGHYPMIVFSDCTIFENRIIPLSLIQNNNLQTQVGGAGAIFSNKMFVLFCGETIFDNNNGTALYLTGSIASFQPSSIVVFTHNSGTNGGGIALHEQSYLYLKGPSNFTFRNNMARQLGGGIYFYATDDIIYQPCFIYNGTKHSRFNFRENHAQSGRGHHVFASSHLSCKSYCNKTSIYECIGNFNFSEPEYNSTATFATNFSLQTDHMGRISVYPGLSSKLPLFVRDEDGNTVSNISYQATLIDANSTVLFIHPEYQYVSGNTINICGEQRQNATLRLDTLNGETSLLIEVRLADCPPGYAHKNNQCVCNANAAYGIVMCDPDACIRPGIWMGLCNNSNLGSFCTSDCPVGYCSHVKYLYQKVPMNETNPENVTCSPTRHGPICGKCKSGYSVFFHSWSFACTKDEQCHLGLLYYFLSTLLPLTILFMIITLMDVNFASGWNGFIIFSQVVNTFYLYGNGAINYPNIQFHILNWLMCIYSFFNLELFNVAQFEFCIWKGANVMDVLMVKLGSICFALGLVIVTVYILNQHKLAKYFPFLLRRRYTVINGISTFLILCYAQCAKTCLQVFGTSCFFDENFNCIKKVVFLSGDMELFEGAHFKYAVIALLFLVVIVIAPPALLLFYPLFFQLLGLCKLSETRVAMYLWRKIPIQLLDSFQNPFKNQYRFFAGLYFLYRTTPLVIYVVTKKLMQYYVFLELTVGIMIILHYVFQPYKNRLYNITDLLLFLNIAIIKGITLYNYMVSTTPNVDMDTSVYWLSSFQIIFLILPLITVAIIIILKFANYLKDTIKRQGYRTIEPVT